MVIYYEVNTNHVNQHLIHVEMKFRAPFEDPELEMPVWTPGSYLVRDYSRHVLHFKVFNTDHNQVRWEKKEKNIWCISASKGDQLTVNYQVYAFELTVRTSYLDNQYGFISPAGLFFYIRNDRENCKNEPYYVKIHTLPDWRIFTSLEFNNGWYVAQDFDELVDSPIALGHENVVETFRYQINRGKNLGEAQCQTILIGNPGNQDIEKFTEDLIKIQKEAIKLFGELPYDRYLWILYVVGHGGGGLEHKFSNVSIIPRWYFKGDEKKVARLLKLESHEHFHTYNIKRIRPSQLGPFDYTKEVYTRLLWVAEGLTSHYDRLILPRCGIITEELYWEIIANDIKELEGQPGRFVTSLDLSSFDAWIKQYKPDENQINSTISYYLKGTIVGLLLDLEIRRQTSWENSLDTFWQEAYNDYKMSSGTGYSEIEFQKLMERYTNTHLDEFFRKYIHGVDELPVNEYLKDIGLKLIREVQDPVFIGWELKKESLKIKSVRLNSPAMKGGISAKDKLVALNGYQIGKEYDTLVKNMKPHEEVVVHYFRDHILRQTVIIPDEPIPTKYKIRELDNASNEQLDKRKLLFSTDTR